MRNKILSLIAATFLATSPAFSTRAVATENGLEVFRCSLIIQDHVLQRRNPLLLEIKDREIKLKKTVRLNDLQVLFSNDELSEIVRGPLQIMGTVVEQQGRNKLKLGFYHLRFQDLRFMNRDSFWIAPATENSSSYYAHPIVESVVKFRPSETYNLDLKTVPMSGFGIGTYEKANHVGVECTHMRSE